MEALVGETLGQRHRSLNNLTNQAVSKKTPFQDIENLPELSDLDRLYKIDVAGKYQIVPYILQNLKSEDDLYVARALKRSIWLIRDPQYSDIVNPEYLHTELFPLMTSRAIAKMWRHIRLNLKDEKRAELFYKYLDNNDKKTEALKWLPSCSAAFLEDRVQIEWNQIEIKLYKKLCEKSVKTFEIIIKKRQNQYLQLEYCESVMFLLNSHMDKFLTTFEELANYKRPILKKRATKLILSKQPERVMEKLEIYIKHINLTEFGKYLGPDGTKDIILKLTKIKPIVEWFNYKNMKPLAQRLPKEGKFEFIKSVFIDKSALESDNHVDEMSDGSAISIKKLESKLPKEAKDKMFNFLRSELQKRLDSKSVNEQNDLKEIITTLNDIFGLLKDWNKDLDDNVLNLVRQLIKNKKPHEDLCKIYDTAKKWRKSLFEESLDLSQTEAVYMNALKHKPSLILHRRAALDKIIRTGATDLSRILKKIRVYFPDKVTSQWLNIYEEKLNACHMENLGYKAITRGICILMERDKFLNLLQAYVPENYNIQLTESDAAIVNLRKYLAQQMYLVRPTVQVDTVLLFSKGDYLQYAFPSLTSVCHRKSREECRKFLPSLLNGTVSLQKYGIRLAFTKLESKELSETFNSRMLKTINNASIREVIFNLTFDLLCREKNENKILKLWGILKSFMDNMTKEKLPTIYSTLAKVSDAPKFVRAELCVMSYKLLKSLPAHLDYDSLSNGLLGVMADVMDTIDEDFVTEILAKYIKEMYVQKKILQNGDSSDASDYDMSNLITKYIITCRSDEIQARRFENILKSITDHSILMWNEMYESLQARDSFINLSNLINSIITATKDTFEDQDEKYVNPVEIFRNIEKATRDLPKDKNYKLLTTLKFAIAYCESYETVSPDLKAIGEKMEPEKYTEFISNLVAPEFSKYCLALLREDVKNYSPISYYVFGSTLCGFLCSRYHNTDIFVLNVLRAFTANPDNIPAYYVAMVLYPSHIDDYEDDRNNVFLEIRKRFVENKNDAVRLYYYTLLYVKDQR